jgi:dTDP-4-amino-4,6-dideoxygalactose transaminase
MKPASLLAARPHFAEEDLPQILADIEGVLRTGVLILGPETQALEEEFARSVGTRYAVAVSSCTAALEIALRALGASGREVIVPTNTFAATAAAALRATREVRPTCTGRRPR